MTDQHEMFPASDPGQAEVIDVKAWADAVGEAGERRGPVEERAPSEAAEDQGWKRYERTIPDPREDIGSVALRDGVIDADEPVYFGLATNPKQNEYNAKKAREARENFKTHFERPN